MAMRQLVRKIPVVFRAATVGSAARQLHPVTAPLSYGFGASFPSGGAAFSPRRFFCTEPPPHPERLLPRERRTQAFLAFMSGFTYQFIKLGVLVGVGISLLIVVGFRFDIRRKDQKLLTQKVCFIRRLNFDLAMSLNCDFLKSELRFFNPLVITSRAA